LNAKTYILDTSALLTYIEDEDGADDVNRILIDAEDGQANVLISFISLTELFYVTRREVGEEKALERVQLVRSLALSVHESDQKAVTRWRF
jgi:predicted nucleic acid-binding protein